MPFFSPLWATGPPCRVPPSRARRDVEDGAAAEPREVRRDRREAHRAADLPAQPHRHAVRVVARRADPRAAASRPTQVTVVPPGIDPRFTPGGDREVRTPLVVAVGRLMPVKRFDELIKVDGRGARARIRPSSSRHRRRRRRARDARGAGRRPRRRPIGCRLPGRLSDDALVDLYRRAWVLASASAAEGWGMTVTEAAACGTPAVVTDIAGHRDAVQSTASPGCSPTRADARRATSPRARRPTTPPAVSAAGARARPRRSRGRPPPRARSPRSPRRRPPTPTPSGAPS